jgi:hypothetical protein
MELCSSPLFEPHTKFKMHEKVGLCMDRKNARYEEKKFGKFVLCENYNVIKL